jgi:hypothetical protein
LVCFRGFFWRLYFCMVKYNWVSIILLLPLDTFIVELRDMQMKSSTIANISSTKLQMKKLSLLGSSEHFVFIKLNVVSFPFVTYVWVHVCVFCVSFFLPFKRCLNGSFCSFKIMFKMGPSPNKVKNANSSDKCGIGNHHWSDISTWNCATITWISLPSNARLKRWGRGFFVLQECLSLC